MAPNGWSTWVKWEGSIEKTLAAGQHAAAGELSLAEARKRSPGGFLGVAMLDDQRHLGRCWVLGGAELHQHFGSKTPPKRAIDAGREAFVDGLEPGQAVAVTAFARGLPTAVLFAGRTDR